MWRLLLTLACCAGAADHLGVVDVRSPAPVRAAEARVERWQHERVAALVCSRRALDDVATAGDCAPAR